MPGSAMQTKPATLFCLLLLAAVASGAVCATQTEPVPINTIPVGEDEAPAVPPEPAVQLDDIIVTATKREQSVRDIAGTVHALDGAVLERIGARDMQDFITRVPGITMQEGVNNAWRKFTIRGIGSGDRTNQTVGQLIGDVPVTDPSSAYVMPDLDPFDLRTVEVLKGPQGTVFGASALNGAIRYVPNAPELGEWSGRTFADFLSVSEGGTAPTFGAVLNAPIGESLAVRAGGVFQQIAGVYDNNARGIADADSGRKWSGRAMAQWDATERLSVAGLYLRQESERDDRSVADNREGRLESDSRPGASRFEVAFDLANVDVRYAFDSFTLISQTSRLTKRQDMILDAGDGLAQQPGEQGVQFLRVAVHPRIESYVQELRAVSADDGSWTWIGGIFFQDYEADLEIGTYANAGPLPPPVGTEDGVLVNQGKARPLAAREQALFGELTVPFAGRWSVTAGARLYQAKLDAKIERSGEVSTDPSATGGHFQHTEKGLGPKVALSFEASEGLLGYVTVARGFQFGGVNANPKTDPRVVIPPTYESSTLWSYEAGVRSDWLQRTLRLDLTVFLLDWTNAQISQLTPQPDSTYYVDTVGAVRSHGLEATGAWLLPVAGLSLESTASWIVARTAQAYESNGSVVPAGTDMPASPRLQTATTLAYEGWFGTWLAGAAIVHTYTGKAYSNFEHAHEIYGYQGLDLHLNTGRPDIRYAPTLILGVTNLLDQRGLLSRTSSDSVGGQGAVSSYYNRPRTFSLRLTAKF